MKQPVVTITLVVLATVAVYGGSLAMFTSAAGLAVALLVSARAGIGTRLTMIVVGALAGGLAGEIVHALYMSAGGVNATGASLYINAMLLSLINAAAIVAAVLCQFLWRRFVKRA